MSHDDDDDFRKVKDAMRMAAILNVQAYYKEMVKVHTGSIEMLDDPTIDEYGTVTIGSWGGYLVQIVPMIFNDRLVMTPKRQPMVFDFGWCYDKGAAAYLAAAVWEPQFEAEPLGFKKRVGPLRRAGEDVEEELSHGEAYAAGIFSFLDRATR